MSVDWIRGAADMSENAKGWIVFVILIAAMGIVGHIETLPVG